MVGLLKARKSLSVSCTLAFKKHGNGAAVHKGTLRAVSERHSPIYVRDRSHMCSGCFLEYVQRGFLGNQKEVKGEGLGSPVTRGAH